MGGPIPDNVYDYDYNDRLDYFVPGEVIFPECRESGNILDILRYKRLRNQLNFFSTKANHIKKL